MSWLSPKTVRGWFVLIVMSALVLSQAVSVALLLSQQTLLRTSMHEAEALNRVERLVSLARNADVKTLSDLQITASGPTFIVAFTAEPSVKTEKSNTKIAKSFARRIGSKLEDVRVAWDATHALAVTTVLRREGGRAIVITRTEGTLAPLTGTHEFAKAPLPPIPPVPPAPPPAPPAPPAPPQPHIVLTHPHVEWSSRDSEIHAIELPMISANVETETVAEIPERFDIAVQLKPALWLNVSAIPAESPSIMGPLAFAGLSAAVLLALSAVWAAGRISKPIAGLTLAANRLGSGDTLAKAPEEGPADVRAASKAFNTMAVRLRRLIEDQQALLRAVGHDLRTPIAALRIRTELVKDPELQSKMQSSLEDMERLTEAALAAARGGETGEPARQIDLPSLVEAVCDDLAEMKQPVTCTKLEPSLVYGRASELRRGLRNLIENAVRYGKTARVSMFKTGDGIEIIVDDDGPGIPESELENVFKPFVRLEESRSEDTGGHGLGLTISRAIVLRHGGELSLSNNAGGGLRATIRLPLAS